VAAVDLNVVPELARPDAVSAVIAEAVELRERLRLASEELAGMQAELELQEARDVEQAAKRIRSGEAPGSLSTAISKSRHAVEVASRNRSALALAADAALVDLASVMHEHGAEWIEALEHEKEQAHERAVEALSAFESAAQEISTVVGAASWIRSAIESGRWDARLPRPLVGSMATSSRRVTANSEPLSTAQLVAYLREAIEPPPPEPAPVVEIDAA
jgi:hypothetical protein